VQIRAGPLGSRSRKGMHWRMSLWAQSGPRRRKAS
jgi:hypothetical protein